MRVLILYDNVAHPPLREGWGFSALVEVGKRKVLFDAGADRLVLAHNARALGVDLAQVTDVFLSHAHCDHVGGLSYVLEKVTGVRMWALKGMASHLRRRARGAGVHIVDEPCDLGGGVLWSTGTMGRTVREHGLVLTSPQGGVLITGCAHPGVVRMACRATKIVGARLRLVLGGFHLSGASSHTIHEAATRLADTADSVAPGHCTGKEATAVLVARFRGSEALRVGKEVRVAGSAKGRT